MNFSLTVCFIYFLGYHDNDLLCTEMNWRQQRYASGLRRMLADNRTYKAPLSAVPQLLTWDPYPFDLHSSDVAL